MKTYQKPGGVSQASTTQQQTIAGALANSNAVSESNQSSALSFINTGNSMQANATVSADQYHPIYHSVDSGSGVKSGQATQLSQSVQFSAGQAILWQIKFIINCYLSKKNIAQVSSELQLLSDKFGPDFDKYLFKELIEQIDLNDPNKALKDKNEAIKSQLLNQELTRSSQKPQFLSYFGELADTIYGGRYSDFISELIRRLKLSPKMALLIALSLAYSCPEKSQAECNTILKAKMIEFLNSGVKSVDVIEEYAVHRISYLCSSNPDFNEQQQMQNPKLKEAIRSILSEQSNNIKPNQSVALRLKITNGDLINLNPSSDDPSNSLVRIGSGLEYLQQANKFLEPWEILLDLGHFISFNYQQLIMALQDFKDINEKTMANTILHLALNNTGQDTIQSRIVLNTFEANKLGDPQLLRKEPSDKNTTLQWQIVNFARAFREIYSNLSYYKVFESFSELSEGLDRDVSLDAKAYTTLLQLFNKSKPQNLQVPVSLILDGVWKSPSLQLSFIKNAIRCYTSNEDKTFSFSQNTRKIPSITEITPQVQATPEIIDVWSQPEVVEALLRLSTNSQYTRVRETFDLPLKIVPEHLLLTLSKCNISQGSLLIDELLSILMPIFIGNHVNSIPVLKKLWDYNQNLMIRSLCELCSPDHKILNLSRVLDITQEIKDSLIKIVYCQDYDFAVKLCILAGKREFFHYDVWLKERIKGVGSPFVKALVKYINEEIIVPCKVEMIKQGINQNKPLTQQQIEALEEFKEQILERSHLSKERLCLTMENLENPANFQSLVSPPNFVPGGAKENNNVSQQNISFASTVQGQLSPSEKIISFDAQNQIKDLIAQYAILFPRQVSPTQSTDEIDKAANEYFQHIFSAPPEQVDIRIQALIVTMQNFRKSQVVKEQEIYACMLHCLFDEYRFLHRYPQQYLEKIAKLFGAIIKNKLLDSILQDIALKFVIEAFRREGKRQSFGIIVIKEFFDCLPEFPRQFQDIYAIREKVQRQDPQLYEDLGRLYAATLGNKDYEQNNQNKIQKSEGTQSSTAQLEGQSQQSNFLKSNFESLSDGIQNTSSFQIGEQALQHEENKAKQKNQANQQQKGKFVGNFEENAINATSFQPSQYNAQSQNASTTYTQQKQPVSQNNQRNKNQAALVQAQKSTIQDNIQVKATTNVSNQSHLQNQQADLSKQSMPPIFVPSQNVKNLGNQQIAHNQKPISNLSVASAAFTHQQALQPNTRALSNDSMSQVNINVLLDPLQQKSNMQQNLGQRLTATSTDQTLQQAFKPDVQLVPSSLADVALKAKSFRPWEITDGQGVSSNLNPSLRNTQQQMPNLNTFVAPFHIGASIPQDSFYLPSAHSSELIAWAAIQGIIDQKIADAKNNKTRLRFEDLIEDNQQELPTQDAQETIKFICNNTGKTNFDPKLEDLKQVVRPSEVNLKWFINYILTKRISVQYQKQQHIYIDLVRQLGIPDSVSRTIKQAVEIFKKCMLVDEVEFNKVANKPVDNQQKSMLKQYLAALGSFIGALTLANNTPISRNELDLKQLLLQGFFHEQRKIIVTFICKILKEANKSLVFKVQNPWINSLLQIMYEIFEVCQQPHLAQQDDEIIMEITLLFKAFNINGQREITINGQGALQALQRQFATSVCQQVELNYLNQRTRCLPIRQKPQRPIEQPQNPTGAYSREISQLHNNNESQVQTPGITQQVLQPNDQITTLQNQQFLNNIQIAPEAMKCLTTKFNLSQDQIRSVVSEAVDASIVDILTPVVDRSVTIALITTRELVLKDFAYDGNIQRVIEAADQIVQNLAGSLALVTCREPLRISLQNHLLKFIKRACQQQVEQELRNEMQNNPPQEQEARSEARIEARINMYIAEHDDELLEIAQSASKENLDLGCKMIKRAVIEKALRKVREDQVIIDAIEKRERAAQNGIVNFVDEEIAKNMVDLPPQLQPNRNGLDAAQFKVYSDFSKLNYHSRMDQTNLNSLQPGVTQNLNENYQLVGSKPGASAQTSNSSLHLSKKLEPAIYDFELDNILQKIDKEGALTSVTRALLTLKLNQISKESDQPQSNLKPVFEKISNYCEDKFQKICYLFDNSPQEAFPKLEILSMIVRKSVKQNLSLELLDKCFLQMEECYLLNPDLTVQLIKHQIINISAWDRKLIFFVRESPGQLHEKASEFLTKFIQISILAQRFIKPEMVPNVIKLMEEFQTSKVSSLQNPSIRGMINQTMHEIAKLQISAKEAQLKTLYQKWVELSYIDDSAAQEKEMNNYFSDLGALGIDQDKEMLFTFCNVMVKHSIELAIYTRDGKRRTNNNTLDYRFIDSFIKLVIVLLKTFDFNKREFMEQIFEFIRQKLDADHKAQQGYFNQKPFYRMLMNILTAVNMSNCFNQKIQRQILFDIADLFKELNPNNYPAFAFAWLELISHKQFMPHFIKRQSLPFVEGKDKESKDKETQEEKGSQNTEAEDLSQKQFQKCNSSLQGQKEGSGNSTDPTQQITNQTQKMTQTEMNAQYQKQCKIKDLIVQSFTFLKYNMIPGQKVSPALQSFYTAIMRILLVVLKDYPQFLCDFHFNFVNSLPDQAIQLKNMILAAFPRSISPPNPLSQDLKVDTLQDVRDPKILSNFEAYLRINGIADDLIKFFATKNFDIVPQICNKMMASKENINGRIIPSSTVINAVILFIATQVCNEKKHGAPDSAQKDNVELLKQMTLYLNDETRLCFLNSIVNELRYPNSHTFYFCMILLILFYESNARIQEQISTILFERLQAQRPFPWGLMINFRELIQNTKYGFMRSEFIAQNQVAISFLFKHRLRLFIHFIQPQQLQQQRHHIQHLPGNGSLRIGE